MKKFAIMLSMLALAFTSVADTIDTYRFKMYLNVPRIYNNSQSKGWRKYQKQTFDGTLQVIYKDNGETSIKVSNLKNKTHKLSNGSNVTYEYEEYPYECHTPFVVAMGYNSSGRFPWGGIRFSFVADPSYNIGGVEEDNTLMLELSGNGNIRNGIPKNFRGSVTGQIGCGCMAYGHVSPTRFYFGGLTSIVYDIAPLNGTWTAIFKSRIIESDR